MVFRVLEKEKKGWINEEIVSDVCLELFCFVEVIVEVCCVFDRFKEDLNSLIIEDEVFVMRIYILRKYNIFLKVRFCFYF